IFVFVKSLEPEPVGDRVLLIIISERVGYILAGETSRQHIGDVVAGVGTEIQAWTVKRIDEPGGIAYHQPALVANFPARVGQRGISVDVALDNLGGAENLSPDRMGKEMGAQPISEIRALHQFKDARI